MATEEDKVNNGALATLAAVLTFGIFGIYMALTALTRDQVAQEFATKEAPQNKPYEELVAAQRQKLTQGLPIDQAMQKVVADLAQNPESATPPPAVGASGAAGSGGGGASGGGAGGAASGASGAGSGGAGSGGATGKAAQSASGGAGGSGRTPTGIPIGEERLKAQQPNRLPQDATAPPPGAIAPKTGVPIAHPEPAVSPK